MKKKVMNLVKKIQTGLAAGITAVASNSAFAQVAGLDHADSVFTDANTWVYQIFPTVGGIAMVVAGIAYFKGRMGQGLAFNVCIGCLIVGMGPGLVTWLSSLSG